jgi:hypothetical protein
MINRGRKVRVSFLKPGKQLLFNGSIISSCIALLWLLLKICTAPTTELQLKPGNQ